MNSTEKYHGFFDARAHHEAAEAVGGLGWIVNIRPSAAELDSSTGLYFLRRGLVMAEESNHEVEVMKRFVYREIRGRLVPVPYTLKVHRARPGQVKDLSLVCINLFTLANNPNTQGRVPWYLDDVVKKGVGNGYK